MSRSALAGREPRRPRSWRSVVAATVAAGAACRSRRSTTRTRSITHSRRSSNRPASSRAASASTSAARQARPNLRNLTNLTYPSHQTYATYPIPMPEGDTIFRAARTLDRALAGREVTAFDTHLAQLAVVDRRAPVSGRTVVGAAARGKHLLIEFTGDLFLRSHMRMHGSWHLYRPGERWRARRIDARIVITTPAWLAIAFNVSDAEFISRDELERHTRLTALGPDLLSESF